MKRLLILLAVYSLCQAAPTEAKVEQWVLKAERLELYSIESQVIYVHDMRPGAPKDEAERIREHRVLGKVVPRSKTEEQMIKDAIVAALRSVKEGPPQLCFEPREAVRLFVGKETVDLLLCFTCENGRAYSEGKDAEFFIGPAGYREISLVLDAHEVKRERPASKPPHRALGLTPTSVTDRFNAPPRQL